MCEFQKNFCKNRSTDLNLNTSTEYYFLSLYYFVRISIAQEHKFKHKKQHFGDYQVKESK